MSLQSSSAVYASPVRRGPSTPVALPEQGRSVGVSRGRRLREEGVLRPSIRSLPTLNDSFPRPTTGISCPISRGFRPGSQFARDPRYAARKLMLGSCARAHLRKVNYRNEPPGWHDPAVSIALDKR